METTEKQNNIETFKKLVIDIETELLKDVCGEEDRDTEQGLSKENKCSIAFIDKFARYLSDEWFPIYDKVSQEEKISMYEKLKSDVHAWKKEWLSTESLEQNIAA